MRENRLVNADKLEFILRMNDIKMPPELWDALDLCEVDEVMTVEHGHWSLMGSGERYGAVCSACGHGYEINGPEAHVLVHRFRYCPNCAARMDG